MSLPRADTLLLDSNADHKLGDASSVSMQQSKADDIDVEIVSMCLNSSKPIAISNLSDGTYVIVNDAFCRLFQYPRVRATKTM